jgi:hypothetical protein
MAQHSGAERQRVHQRGIDGHAASALRPTPRALRLPVHGVCVSCVFY